MAVAWADLKNAMLYFDKIICPNANCFIEAYCDRVSYIKLLEEINPTGIPITEEPYGFMIHSSCLTDDDELEAALPPGVVLHNPIQFPMSSLSFREWIGSRPKSLGKFFSGEISMESLRQIRKSIPYRQAPAFVPSANVLLGERANYGRLVLTVANLKLVDGSALPWEQLFSLRSDKHSLQRLRRVFLLPLEAHGHKSMYEFEQEIEIATDEHQTTAAELGLSTAVTALNLILKDGTEICSGYEDLYKTYMTEPPNLARWQSSSISEQPLFVHLWRREITWEADFDRNPVAILMWQNRSA